MSLVAILVVVSFILVTGSAILVVLYFRAERKEAANIKQQALKRSQSRPIRGYEVPGGRLLEYRSDFTYAPVSSAQKRNQPAPTKPRRVEDVRRSEDYSVPAVFETVTWSDPSSSYTDSSNCDTGSSYASGGYISDSGSSSSYDSGSSSSYDSGSSGSCDTGSSW